MAGIGEASAIITVTQLGFSFASKLGEFLGDYRKARPLIKSLSDEVEATATSLQRLGELAKQNGLYNPKGAADAMNLTERCERTITEIRIILKLDRISLDPATKCQELELTRFDRLKWAASKTRLEIPRAELGRLKSEMMLLYLTLMAFRAETPEDQQRFASGIPGEQKKLRWANARYEELQRRQAGKSVAQESVTSVRRSTIAHREQPSSEDEVELEQVKEYREFVHRRAAEHEEKRQREALAIRQLAEDQRKKDEEQSRKDIAEAAVDEYKSIMKAEDVKREQKRQELQSDFQDQLQHVGLDEAEVEHVVDVMVAATMGEPCTQTESAMPLKETTQAKKEEMTEQSIKAKTSFLRRVFQRRARDAQQRATRLVGAPGASAMVTEEGFGNLQSWIIDQASGSNLRTFLSNESVSRMIAAEECGRKPSLAARYDMLSPYYQRQISRLCYEAPRSLGTQWVILYLKEVGTWKNSVLRKTSSSISKVHIVLRQEQETTGKQMRDQPERSKEIASISRHGSRKGSYFGSSAPSAGRTLVNLSGERGTGSLAQGYESNVNKTMSPVLPRTINYYFGQDAKSQPRLYARVEESNKDLPQTEYPRRGRTKLSPDHVDVRAVSDFGYDFVEADGEIVVAMALDWVGVQRLLQRTDLIRKADRDVGGRDFERPANPVRDISFRHVSRLPRLPSRDPASTNERLANSTRQSERPGILRTTGTESYRDRSIVIRDMSYDDKEAQIRRAASSSPAENYAVRQQERQPASSNPPRRHATVMTEIESAGDDEKRASSQIVVYRASRVAESASQSKERNHSSFNFEPDKEIIEKQLALYRGNQSLRSPNGEVVKPQDSVSQAGGRTSLSQVSFSPYDVIEKQLALYRVSQITPRIEDVTVDVEAQQLQGWGPYPDLEASIEGEDKPQTQRGEEAVTQLADVAARIDAQMGSTRCTEQSRVEEWLNDSGCAKLKMD